MVSRQEDLIENSLKNPLTKASPFHSWNHAHTFAHDYNTTSHKAHSVG